MFNCGPLFNKNLYSPAKIVINQGGQDSGKTVAIIQVCAYLATTQAPAEDPIITIISQTVPDSKKGAYRKFEEQYNTSVLKRYIKDWNKSDRTIIFKTGWILEFVAYDSEQKAKQGKRQYAFFNEANGISWGIFRQVASRTRRKVFVDYNPSAPFWAHEKLIGTTPKGNDLHATVELIISDHRHNPFLTKEQHTAIENIKDKETWRVYARGLTGNLSGLIYPNWRQIPDKDFPWDEPMFGGLDFGYTNDPTAGSRMCRIGENIYIHELCYEPGLTARQIYGLFAKEKFTLSNPVYCEHDTGMIRELRAAGLMALQARKGPNSISPGIAKVKEFNIFYTESSKNIDFERKKYMWQKDPITAKFINVPTEVDNHHMDEIRYAITTHFYRSPN